MLLSLAVLLALGWVLGFTVFHVVSFGIHVLLLVAVVAAIAHFVRGTAASS
ncbi:MAG TPA: DUF5670 family protein [Kofleriaceae bacterium]|jgi:hypothetical protein